jgi:uncharacterized membrane protein
MNWDLILTTVGILTTLVLFTPIFIVYALGFYKSRVTITMEVMDKYHQESHKDDINWNQIFEGENR